MSKQERERRDQEVVRDPDIRGVAKGRRVDLTNPHTDWDVSDPDKVESTWKRDEGQGRR